MKDATKDVTLTDQDYIIIEAALDFVLRKHNVGILDNVAADTLRRVKKLGGGFKQTFEEHIENGGETSAFEDSSGFYS